LANLPEIFRLVFLFLEEVPAAFSGWSATEVAETRENGTERSLIFKKSILSVLQNNVLILPAGTGRSYNIS
jgi:hypothetical protein